MIEIWKHEVKNQKSQTFLVIIKYGNMANFVLVLKENLFEDFMIDNFAKLIVEHEMDDEVYQIITGEPVLPDRLKEFLL